MAIIRTVLGDITPEELGYTSVHEHTIYDSKTLGPSLIKSLPAMIGGATAYEGGADVAEEATRRKEEGLDKFPPMSVGGVLGTLRTPRRGPARELSTLEYYVNELAAFRERGGRTVCDCTPVLSMPSKGGQEQLRELSRRSGVNVVCAVGYYTRPSIPKRLWKEGEATLRARIDEYLEGPARVGIVKCAISELDHGELCLPEHLSVRACATAARDTGMSLHIHTAFPIRRATILALAAELEGILPPNRVLFCHQDSYNLGPGNPAARIGTGGFDADFPAELCARGFHIGLDTWANPGSTPEGERFQIEAREGLLAELVARGHVNSITLGHDLMSKSQGVQMGKAGYTGFPCALERMVADGRLTPEQVHILIVDNPAKLLAF